MRDVKILESQFREAIRGVDTALKAGYSVENAFVQSGKDMERQFGKESFIHEELEAIRRGLVINITLEEMLADLAERSGSEAIEDFKLNQDNIERVNKYYGSDSWFKDKEAYEKRRIPHIKAGVLSEDAVWNMLNDIKDLVSEMQIIIDNYFKLNNK